MLKLPWTLLLHSIYFAVNIFLVADVDVLPGCTNDTSCFNFDEITSKTQDCQNYANNHFTCTSLNFTSLIFC